jgi:phosphate transport system substrate-binding protein
MKRILSIATLFAVILTALCACGKSSGSTISVITREEGSGTRGAFVELLGIVDGDGNDNIVKTAEATNSTSVMMTTVAGNKNAIGYVSLGSLSSDVKAIKVDGAEPTVANIEAGTYKVARPFNLVYNDDKLSDVAADFVKFIMSSEGQAVVTKKGYISVRTSDSYKSSGLTGTVVLDGSTSVGPLMDAIADEYKKLNPDVKVQIQQTGSSAGINSAIEGVCDIGMSSRELKSSESAKIKAHKMATDGIAVIVNNSNTVDGLTSEQIKSIFLGETTSWDGLAK